MRVAQKTRTEVNQIKYNHIDSETRINVRQIIESL